MTEVEWLACEDPKTMLDLIAVHAASDRKLRLFQVACCCRAWDLMPNTIWRDAVGVAEQYADKETNDKKRIAALNRLQGIPPTTGVTANAILAAREANKKTMERRSYTWYGVAGVFGNAAREADSSRDGYRDAFKHEREAEAHLLREIFGNPFRPVAFDPSWRTTDVMLLAQGIYDEKSFDRMPILADALQDAGCASEELLSHLRDANATHVRGCWALDLVLGKE